MDVGLTVTLTPPKFLPANQAALSLKSALRIFDTYYRRRIAQRFASEGPGWPPRVAVGDDAQKTRDEKVRALAEHKLKVKLFRELRRAQSRLSRGKGTTAALLRRARVVEEFKKQVSGDQSPFYSSDKRAMKSVGKLRERFGRAEAAASARLLGRMPSAMRSKISGLVLTVINTISWSGAQNEGATVGHGAKLPARPFNYLDATDVEVFAEIVENLIIAAAAG